MHLTLEDLLNSIAKSEIQPQHFRAVLTVLLNSENLTLQKLIKMTRFPRSLVVKILKQLQMFLEPLSQYILVKPENIVIFMEYLEEVQPDYLQRYDWIQLKDNEEKLESFFNEVIEKRLPSKRSLDQFDATSDTVMRRVKFLDREGMLNGTQILFLGDYDLTSILVSIKGSPKEIHVIDIDPEILSLIQKIADDYQFPIKTHHQDLRLDFPKQLLSYFDVVFTDPPFTLNGAKLFLLHALRALAPQGTIYCCFGYSLNNLNVGIQFQEVLNELGLVARTILENFNIYSKAQSIGSTSHLFKLKPARIPVKMMPFQIGHPIYSGYREKEDLTQLIGPVRYRLIQEELIAHIMNKLFKDTPKSIAFLNAPFGPLQSQLLSKGILIKDIETETIQEELTYRTNIPEVQIVYPPSSNLESTYESLFVESPCFNLDPLIEWIKLKFCKKVFLMLPDQIEAVFENSETIEATLWTKKLLSHFWNWNLILSIPPEAFDPHFIQTAYLYEGVFLQKELLVTQPDRFILREIFEQPTKVLLNALREALIRFYERNGVQFTKNQSNEFIKNLELTAEILHLRVQQLSDNELKIISEELSKNIRGMEAI